MKLSKLLIAIVATTAFMSSCKKHNDDEIIGTWTMSEIYIDNAEARFQYAEEDSMDCNGYQKPFTPYYQVKSLKWEIPETQNLVSTELGTSFSVSADYCNNSTYNESDVINGFEGSWSINDDGKGDKMTINIDGGILNVDIIDLGEYNLIVEYDLSGLKHRIHFSR